MGWSLASFETRFPGWGNLMSEPIVKSHKWWVFCRIYAPLGMAAWFATGIFSFSGTHWMLYALISFPFAVIGFLMLFTLAAFRFDYSCFGRYKRTPWPGEDPILVEKTPGGQVGLVWGWQASAFVWMVCPSGLAIRIPFCGKAFIPLDAIQEVRHRKDRFRATLIHKSPEVRSPISIPSKAIVKGIERLLEERRIQSGEGGQAELTE